MKARAEIFIVKLLKTSIFVLLLVSPLCVLSQAANPHLEPLPNGFAHNDYAHTHPLFDALENGYTNLEADVFLEEDSLIIAHFNPFFRAEKTLETLYLKPLAAIVKRNNGRVYTNYPEPVILMIDVKTGANNTYAALKPVLQKYSFMFTSYNDGKVTPGAITVVLSGHKPFKMLKNEKNRLAFIDEDLRRSDKDTTAVDVYKMSSCKYSKLLSWTGRGGIQKRELTKLENFIAIAHRFHKKVRLWASPENAAVWEKLLSCGVDLINTDKLVTLRQFLIAHKNKETENEQAMMLSQN